MAVSSAFTVAFENGTSFERSFEIPEGVEIREVHEFDGRGLFSTKHFKKGQHMFDFPTYRLPNEPGVITVSTQHQQVRDGTKLQRRFASEVRRSPFIFCQSCGLCGNSPHSVQCMYYPNSASCRHWFEYGNSHVFFFYNRVRRILWTGGL